ncbi:TraR/DksA C4-type zinc finger protein [Aquamicrobium soli]|uniref:TraR/DksA C4-type zinc finger protein n=1 Tax=Aquamicrobium soli TaxID=1811518 RepID=A0ABV7KAM7_9HYPH
MGNVVSLARGRQKLGKALPKPRMCGDCGDDIETARLQVQPKARRCISCEKARERRHRKMLETMRDDDIAIIRR